VQMPPDDVLAIDLGGTQMRAALVSTDGSVSRRRAAPTTSDDQNLDSLFELAGEVVTKDVSNAVVAVPGRVNYRLERLEHAPNLPERWTGLLRKDHLEDRLGLEVALANDADAAAVGESYFGAGRHYDDVAYITVSTGVGGGAVFGGQLVRGQRSSIGIGHTVIDRVALSTGRPASVEDLASGTALETAADLAGLSADGRRVVELVEKRDERATRLWQALVDALVVGVGNLAYLVMPQVIVLGGGVGLNGRLLLDPIRRHLSRHGPPSLPEPIRVVTATLGDDAGLVGAAAWRRATRGERRSGSTISHMTAGSDTPRRDIA
jgi:glucokinase